MIQLDVNFQSPKPMRSTLEIASVAYAPNPNGKSAYQLAVDGGYQGSLKQWLASLKGDKGDKGDSYVITQADKQEIENEVFDRVIVDPSLTQRVEELVDEAAEQAEQAEAAAREAAESAEKAGKSAYQLAVDSGYQGTLEQWLVDLKGEKGDKGNVMFATFHVDENSDLIMTTPDEYTGPMFRLNENKELEVII